MKKLLVVLLSVLLLFSFVSCKDKSEEIKADYEAKIQAQKDEQAEMIKNFEDFMDAYKKDVDFIRKFVKDYSNHTSPVFNENDGDVNKTLSENCYPTFEPTQLEPFVSLKDGEKIGSEYGTANSSTPSGTVTGKSTNSTNKDLTFTNNTVTSLYSVNNSEGTELRRDQTLALTINGTFKEVDNDDVHTVDYNLTINDKTYQLSYTYDKKTDQVTAAKINGKDVERRLFNADGVAGTRVK